MTNVPYNTNIPFETNNPSQDQPRMKENTNSTKSLIEIDHFGFGNDQGGYHNVIHLPPQVAAPVAIAGIEQLFSLNVTPIANAATTDTQLFALTGAGGLSQLTGYHAVSEGYVWSNGILIQWGFTSTGFPASSNVQGDILFKNRDAGSYTIDFPNNCFCVVTNLNAGSAIGKAGTVAITAVGTSFFSWTFESVSGNHYNGFYWAAIGN